VPGPQGPAGTPGVIDFYDRTETFSVTNGLKGSGDAQCDSGDLATGGSVYAATGNTFVPTKDGPLLAAGDPVGWGAEVLNNSGGTINFTVWVVCADMAP
jgi:hypothetical protein